MASPEQSAVPTTVPEAQASQQQRRGRNLSEPLPAQVDVAEQDPWSNEPTWSFDNIPIPTAPAPTPERVSSPSLNGGVNNVTLPQSPRVLHPLNSHDHTVNGEEIQNLETPSGESEVPRDYDDVVDTNDSQQGDLRSRSSTSSFDFSDTNVNNPQSPQGNGEENPQNNNQAVPHVNTEDQAITPVIPQSIAQIFPQANPQITRQVAAPSEYPTATPEIFNLTIQRILAEGNRALGMQPMLTEEDFEMTRRQLGLVNDDLVTVDAPRHVNPLFPRPGQVTAAGLRRVARSGSLRSLARDQEDAEANAEAIEDDGGAPAQEEEEEEEEEEEDEEEGRVNLDEVDAPVADQFRAGLAHLSEARVEIDVLDGDLPVGAARGNPAAIRARAGLVFAEGEIWGAVGSLWRSLVEAREIAVDAQEGSRRLQDGARRLATQLIELRLDAAVSRERAVSSEARLEQAELEIARLRARLRARDDE